MKPNRTSSVVLQNGGTVWLPPNPTYPNSSIPDLSVPDSTQKYDIGTAFTLNGKAYYYGYASGACSGSMLACKTYKQEVSYQTVGAAADIYATQLTITVAATDGIAADGALAKDYLKGGTVVVFPAVGGSYYFTRGIVGNTVVASGGGTTVIDLDAPIPVAVDAAASAEATASPWAAFVDSTSAWMTKVGLPTCYSAGSQYIWLQTWGMAWVSPQSTVGTAGYHDVIARHDGSIDYDNQTVDLNISDQRVGYSVSYGAGGAQAAPFIFLQIAHP
jgi:hypothetical protein